MRSPSRRRLLYSPGEYSPHLRLEGSRHTNPGRLRRDDPAGRRRTSRGLPRRPRRTAEAPANAAPRIALKITVPAAALCLASRNVECGQSPCSRSPGDPIDNSQVLLLPAVRNFEAARSSFVSHGCARYVVRTRVSLVHAGLDTAGFASTRHMCCPTFARGSGCPCPSSRSRCVSVCGVLRPAR